jgi:transcriptional regulator with XRE-family HTH domain
MDGRALVARNLRRLRVERGLSQEKLAEKARTDRAFTGQVERASVNSSLDMLEKLAKALDAPLSALFVEPGPDDPEPENLRRGRKPKK